MFHVVKPSHLASLDARLVPHSQRPVASDVQDESAGGDQVHWYRYLRQQCKERLGTSDISLFSAGTDGRAEGVCEWGWGGAGCDALCARHSRQQWHMQCIRRQKETEAGCTWMVLGRCHVACHRSNPDKGPGNAENASPRQGWGHDFLP